MPAGHHLDQPKGGRPRKRADPAQILSMLRRGLTLPETAKALHVSMDTLRRQIKANAELARQVETAHVEVLANMSAVLHRRALEGHVPSIKLLFERLERSRIN